MKVKRLSKQFEPIEIKITLEIKEEAKTMYHLFNRPSIPFLDSCLIRDAISPGDTGYGKMGGLASYHDLWDIIIK